MLLIHTAVVFLYFPKILSILGFPFSIHNYSKHSCSSGQNFKDSTTREHPWRSLLVAKPFLLKSSLTQQEAGILTSLSGDIHYHQKCSNTGNKPYYNEGQYTTETVQSWPQSMPACTRFHTFSALARCYLSFPKAFLPTAHSNGQIAFLNTLGRADPLTIVLGWPKRSFLFLTSYKKTQMNFLANPTQS